MVLVTISIPQHNSHSFGSSLKDNKNLPLSCSGVAWDGLVVREIQNAKKQPWLLACFAPESLTSPLTIQVHSVA